jgi:hypothetical protein
MYIPIGQEAGWASDLVWTQKQDENSLPGTESRSYSLYSDTILTELAQLRGTNRY